MKSTKLLVCAVAVSAAFAAASAQGQSLTATLNGISPGLTYDGIRGNGFEFAYPAGVMNFTEVGSGATFSAFCVEPLQDISFGDTLTYEIQDPTSLTNSNIIARLIGGYLASPPSDQSAAAVQWAIWEVTNESDPVDSLFDGSVRITDVDGSATATLANQYLANVMSFSPVALTYLTHPTGQDVVTWNVVPEPASAVLAALSGLVLLRRRRA